MSVGICLHCPQLVCLCMADREGPGEGPVEGSWEGSGEDPGEGPREGHAFDSPTIPFCQTHYSDVLVKCTQSRLMRPH